MADFPPSTQAPLQEEENLGDNDDARANFIARRTEAGNQSAQGVDLLGTDGSGYTFTAGETKQIEHGLGRAFEAVFMLHTIANANDPAGRIVANASGVGSELAFSWRMTTACTVGFRVY